MERLSRLCHRIVWLNPHKGDAKDFVPTTLGMMVAAPYVDELLSGHDLASLEEFAAHPGRDEVTGDALERDRAGAPATGR